MVRLMFSFLTAIQSVYRVLLTVWASCFQPVQFCDTQQITECKMRTPQKRSELCVKIWSKLPNDLVLIIFKKLPAVDLIRLRTLNKEWMIRITSSEFLPWNFNQSYSSLLLYIERRLVVYRSKSNSWHQKFLQDVFQASPRVFVDPRVTPSRLELIASDGGFLCFTTRDYGHFLVCNPITNQFIHVLFPDKSTKASSSALARGLESNVSIFSSQEPRFGCNRGGQEVLGGLHVDTNTGHFKLILATLHGGTPRRTNIYNSQSKSWTQVLDSPPTGEPVFTRRLSFQIESQLFGAKHSSVLCDDSFYTLVRHKDVFWALFRFDTEKQLWSIVPLRRRVQSHLQLGVYEGKLLLVETPWYARYSFFVIQNSDGEVTSWISVLDPLSQQLEQLLLRLPKEFRVSCCLSCVCPAGDSIYFLMYDHKGNILSYTTEAKKFNLLAYNLQTQVLTCVEGGKDSIDLNLAESKCWAFRPSFAVLAS